MKVAGALCLLMGMAPAVVAADQHQPRIVGDKVSTADLMDFLGIHGWKVRVVGPVHGVSAQIIQYVRTASGQFAPGAVFGSTATNYQTGIKEISVVAMLQDSGKTARFRLTVQGGGSGPDEFPASFLAGYARWGDGAGGEGLKVGDDYILMAKYDNPHVTTASKKDMSAYIALRLVVRK